MDLNRRLLATAAVVGAGGLVLEACTQQQVDDIVAKIADLIQKIQQGVKDACAAAGVLIPTASSVIAVLQALFGTTNPAILTAAQIAQAIALIVGQACAAPPTPPTPGAPRADTPKSVVVNGVVVVFY